MAGNESGDVQSHRDISENSRSEYLEEHTIRQCYCHGDRSRYSLQCRKCEKWFHIECLKSGKPSNLQGDVFFYLVCKDCSDDAEEEVTRMKLQWLQVVMLALYNLHLSQTGKCGYFRWKEHICAFIDKHWNNFFGSSRKKTCTWFGTVAGTLSSGCPQHFKSGATELKEHGWWSLTHHAPPTLETLTNVKPQKKQKMEAKEQPFKVEGLRTRRSKTSFEAAMELKAKRAMTQEAKDIRRRRTGSSGSSASMDKSEDIPSLTLENLKASGLLYDDKSFSSSDSRKGRLDSDHFDECSQMSTSSYKSDAYLTAKDLHVQASLPQFLLKGDEDDESDFEVDPCSITPPDHPGSPVLGFSDSLPRMEDILSSLVSHQPEIREEVDTSAVKMVEVKQEPPDTMVDDTGQAVQEEGEDDNRGKQSEGESESEEDDDEDEDVEESDVDNSNTTQASTDLNKRKRSQPHQTESQEIKPPKRYVAMSVYEEKQLLRQLKGLGAIVDGIPRANRLRRKLIVRQLKRERGLPLFDLDAEMKVLMGNSYSQNQGYTTSFNTHGLTTSRYRSNDYRVLDRYQTTYYSSLSHQLQPVSFLNRLVGTEDDQLQSITSPYTARTLKPFIRRDHETKPQKMGLLLEIQAYPHRNDPTWKAPPPPSIDYCYVRPQHIPSVNALCREFFWPGIDLSECLQYPDFSCVVLYRKFVIGFAFLVPDVKYNEAYISFIFTHPEWRGAGIATFMLYHLIQTCMGKDVTLHVSASNPAMMLYQKFGFKPEEFVLDFYDKYLPVDSVECKHAFFLRLGR